MRIVKLSNFYIMLFVLVLGWTLAIWLKDKGLSPVDFGGYVIFFVVGVSTYFQSEKI